MKDLSIWCKRIIKLVEINFIDGITINDFIKEIKKIRYRDKIPSIFSRLNEQGIRQWDELSRLKYYMFLCVKLGFFKERAGKIYWTDNGKNLKEKKSERSRILLKICEDALESYFGINLGDLIEIIKKLDSVTTARNISRGLNLLLPKDQLDLLRIILQIHADVGDELNSTGKITFGIPTKKVTLNGKNPFKIEEKDYQNLLQIYIKSPTKKKFRNKIKKLTNDNATLKQELEVSGEIVYDELNKELEEKKEIIEKKSLNDNEKEELKQEIVEERSVIDTIKRILKEKGYM